MPSTSPESPSVTSGEPPAALPDAGPAESRTDTAAAETARQRDEYYDLLLRKTAEFDNYRKRIERERRDRADLAAADLIRELLPLIDDLERALKASAAEHGSDALRKGVELIHAQLLDLLARRGVTVIDPSGDVFDPTWHEAVAREIVPQRDGQVIEVYARGYRLGDRLLRPARVRVATS